MGKLHFTDIAIRALKGSKTYETHFDSTTKGFGIRCGLTSKTFLVVKGKKRERITIGRYPDISLAEARTEAKRLLAAEPSPRIVRRKFDTTRDDYLEEHFTGSSDHKYHVSLTLKKHFADLDDKYLAEITDGDVQKALDRIAGPSAKLHAFRAIRTFFNWCVKSPRRYIPISPIHGYETPGSDRKGTRILTDDELKAVWNASNSGHKLVFRLMILWGTRNAETIAIKRVWAENDVLVIPGEHTKNGRDHAIPLLPMAKAVLALRNTAPHYFLGRGDDAHLTPHALAKMFRQVKKDAGVTGFTLRDIRRTFRSNMAKLKVPRDICEVLINHAPPVLDEIYDRYDRIKEKRAALARYEKFVLKLAG